MLTFHPLHEKAPLPRQGRFCFLFLILKKQTPRTLLGSDCLAAGSQEVCLEGKRWERGARGLQTPRNCWSGLAVGLGNLLGLRAGAVALTASAAQPALAPAAPAIVAPRSLPCWRDSPLTSAPSTRGHLQPLGGRFGRARVLPVLPAVCPARPRHDVGSWPCSSRRLRPRAARPRTAPRRALSGLGAPE